MLDTEAQNREKQPTDAISISAQSVNTQPINFPNITFEMALYTIILFAAALLRFYDLSLQPLASFEAANAWAAWLAVTGESAANSPIPTSPLLYALHGLLLWLVGSGDTIVRFIPALFGTGIVVLPWFMRHQIGRHAALLLALLLAIDPWLLAFSRLADGTILSIFFGLLALAGMLHLSQRSFTTEQAQPNRPDDWKARWTNVTAISFGLLVISGSQAWNYLPVLILFALLFLIQPSRDEQSADAPESTSTLPIPISAAILFLASALLGATGWLAFPEGLSYLSTSLSQWADQLLRTPEMGYELFWLLMRLWADQPFIIAFGLLGFLLLWAGQGKVDRRWQLFLTLWLGWALLLNLVPGRTPFSLPVLALPLMFVAIRLFEALLRRPQPLEITYAQDDSEDVSVEYNTPENIAEDRIIESSVLIGTLIILLFSGAIWFTALSQSFVLNFATGQAILIVFSLAVLLILFFLVWVGWPTAIRSSGLFLGGLLLLVTLSNSWQLSHRFDIFRPQGFFQEVSHPDLRLLADDVATISAQRAGSEVEHPIFIQMKARPDPVLGWYLRKMQNLMWVQAPAVQDGTLPAPIVISFSENVETIRLPADYTGSDYSLSAQWRPDQLKRGEPFARYEGFEGEIEVRWSQIQPLLRWLRHRETQNPPQIESILLWAQIGQ